MNTGWRDLATSIGLLVLRLGVGGYMASHGWGKVKMLLSGQAEQFGDPIGLGPTTSVVLVASAEFGCAILVMLGVVARLAAIPPVIAMSVAAFVAHRADPWSMETAAIAFFAGESETWASKEPALMFLVPFLALAFTGPGLFSVDALIWRNKQGGAPEHGWASPGPER